MKDVSQSPGCADWRLEDRAFLECFSLPGKLSSGPLKDTNPFPREGHITFVEKTHTYFADGEQIPRSVTKLLSEYAIEFDAMKALTLMRAGRNWYEKAREFEQLGLDPNSDDDILQHWSFMGKVAAARGTLLHYHAELAANGFHVRLPHSPEFKQVLQLLQYFVTVGWTPFRTEVNIFHSGLRCAGQPDFLCKNQEGDIVIIDWKRVPKLDLDRFDHPFRYPLQHLPSSPYWKYSLQLNLYRFVLESEYALRVSSMWLAVVHPSLAQPRLVEVPTLSQEVQAILDHEISNGRAIPGAARDA